MPFDFGDVILVRFPYTNQTGAKQRPAVVVSRRAYNDARPDLVLMAITSKLRDDSDFGEMRITHWQAANLLKPSAVKPVFATLEQALVVRRLGALALGDQTFLKRTISLIIG